ncbi:RNA editing complex MP57, putative [Babesia ovata]|uniref:RNA editing complex MP57, putative n=1 Tax=Babesia ovata TaxID=189622 RepID=A0A2H6K9Y6_9APIC|nr:RNA editing complex MP57, putative [Babesia ovata]GBE59814.1 RNA editing complex MP57, putative [Babesia ovata]
MELKRKSHICEGVEAAVAEAIRRELRNHDDIARLVWWASTFNRADLTGAARVNRPWMADRRIAAQLVAVDLEAAAPLIDSGTLTLHQRGTVTKGVAVLMFAQCTILLKDARHACRRAYNNNHSTTATATLPRSKTRGRHFASAATPEHMLEPLWNNTANGVLKDTKLRIECLDTRMKTPNAHDGFAYNKIIMGVGIYSQYEFDEQNNIRKQLTQVVKWNAPAAAKSLASGLLGIDDVMSDVPALCNGRLRTFSTKVTTAPSNPPRESTYLHDLDDEVDGHERVQLKKIKRAALEAFDNFVVVPAEHLVPKKRAHHCKTARTALEEHALKQCVPPHGTKPSQTCTWYDIRDTLLKECELKYKTFLVTCAERERQQQRTGTGKRPRIRRGVAQQKSFGESKQKSYPLRSTKARVGDTAHTELFTFVRHVYT